tara:strand:+ start:20 stop:304 length:285 start_codon:yes stop_codon:yes gene_type:complete
MVMTTKTTKETTMEVKAKTINYDVALAVDSKGSHLKVGDIVKVKDDCKCEWTINHVPKKAMIREIHDNGIINLYIDADLNMPNVEPNDFIKLNK